jgi:hypothetical protein
LIQLIWERRRRFEQFGTAGNASKIKVLPIPAVAKRYATGSLIPTERTAHRGEIDRRFLMNVVGKDPKAAAHIAALRQGTVRKQRRDAT